MKASISLIRAYVNDWSVARCVGIFRITQENDWFFIYTKAIEISFQELMDLDNDLHDFGISIHSVEADPNTNRLTISILNR